MVGECLGEMEEDVMLSPEARTPVVVAGARTA